MADAVGTVYAVDEVQLTLLKFNPMALVISARGRTTTSGWSGGQLSQYVYLTPPADSIQEFDFIATRPGVGAIVLTALTPIAAEHAFANFDQTSFRGPGKPLLGVRVYGATNAKVALFEAKPGMPPVTHVGVELEPTRTLSFEKDIRGLFRPFDVQSMAGRIDLRSHTEVAAAADRIFDRLKTSDEFEIMPCDGAWPQTDIDMFKRWMDDGKLP